MKETKMKINDEMVTMDVLDTVHKVNVIMTFDIPISEQGTQLHYDVYVPETVMTDKDLFVEYLCKKMFNKKDWMKHLWKISCSTNISEIIESNSELGTHFKGWYMLTNGKFFRDFGDFENVQGLKW